MSSRPKLIASFVLFAMLLGAGPTRSESPPEVAELYRKSYRAEYQGRQEEALEAMHGIRAKGNNSYFVHVRTGWVAYLAGRLAESEEAYRRAMAADPKAIEPKLGLTLPLLAAKKWRALERACRDVLGLDPKNNAARARLAHAYYSLGNYPDAANLYRGLIADYPGDLDHQTGLGWCLLRMGRTPDAKRVFQQVQAVSPDNPNARQGLGL